jgi:endonuclease/exonuclease/phosphatase (EEP) superfamily protein YafD
LVAAVHLYFAGLSAWLLLWAIFRDRWSWLFAVNSLAVYLFAPLPLAAAVALLARRRDLWLWTALGAAAWAWLFGGLFLPRAPTLHAAGPTLRVLTTNLLGYNQASAGVVAAIQAADADIVAIQELNGANAAALERELAAAYPYRVFNQREGVTGSGVLSRYPFQVLGHLPGPWLGTTHVISLTFEGRPVTLIRFHAYSGIRRLTEREQAAQALADYAARHPDVPLVAAGDLNATGLSRPHEIITGQLRDAWAESGFGLGHTFPGAYSPGSSRPRLGPLPVPQWLVRIDYVFHSDHFSTRSAILGPWDGVSDHRPVLVELGFKE